MQYNMNCLEDQNGKTVLKTFFSTVPAGRREYREHHHAECELSTIISGKGIYTVKDKSYTFGAGDVFVFNGDENHCITDISDNFVLLNIQFDSRILWSSTETFAAMQIFFARNMNFNNKIDPKNPKTAEIHNKIIELEKELSKKQEGYQVIVKYTLFSMLITLVRSFDYIDKNKKYIRFQNTVQPMENALCYIEENLDKNLTLKDIAERASMTPTYFSSVFKKMRGISPWEYITIKRVERAIELLKTTNRTKLDIALSCGFSSSSNFYKAFWRVTGRKPNDYV